MKETEGRSEEFLVLKEEWREKLMETGVPLDEWGKGEAKTLDHLIGEIVERVTVMVFDEEKSVWMRELEGIEIVVFYDHPDKGVLLLKEDRQVFSDGRIRKRGFSWVSEKVEENEEVDIAAIRGLKEELELSPPFKRGPIKKGKKLVEEDSRSYPGLPTKYDMDCFEVWLTPEQFNPEGYVEEQEDKTTFFVWEEMGATYPYSCQG